MMRAVSGLILMGAHTTQQWWGGPRGAVSAAHAGSQPEGMERGRGTVDRACMMTWGLYRMQSGSSGGGAEQGQQLYPLEPDLTKTGVRMRAAGLLIPGVQRGTYSGRKANTSFVYNR